MHCFLEFGDRRLFLADISVQNKCSLAVFLLEPFHFNCQFTETLHLVPHIMVMILLERRDL
jgi:hypothetical protein